MRWWCLLLGLAACPRGGSSPDPEPTRVIPPWEIDAAVPDAPPPPTQSPPTSTAIRASSYAQNCTRDDECIAVFEGNACNACRCAFNAIRKDAFPKYQADLGAFWSCRHEDECRAECLQVAGDPAKCEAGTCTLPP